MAKTTKKPAPKTQTKGVETIDNKVVNDVVKFVKDTTAPLSCLSGNPLMEFGSGNAPRLDYEIPQKTSFTAYGDHTTNLVFQTELTEDQVFMPIAFIEPVLLPPSTTVPITTTAIEQDIINGTSTTVINATPRPFPRTPKPSKPPRTLGGEFIEAKLTNYTENVDDYPQYIPSPKFLANQVALGNAVILNETFGVFSPGYQILPRPNAGNAKPQLFFVEEYTVAFYLANYGAGKTLNVFTLLPGEKTTITVKTYKESIETKKRAENVMDSFSEDSARDFENTLEKESNIKVGENKTTNGSVGLNTSSSVGLKFPIKIFSVNASASVNTSFNASRSVSKTREANTRNLAKSVEKHSNKTKSRSK